MAGKLEGKVAVVTGGSTGIGLATAKRFVAEGAYVFITGRRAAELDNAAAEIGKNVTAVQGDVSKAADLDRLYATVKREKGRVDVVFANAGIGELVPLEKVTEAHFDKLFGVNVKGVLFTITKALPLMSPGGAVVINGSIAGILGMENFGVYNATKAALRSLARTFTTELKGRNIRVNVVSPGPIDTPGIDNAAGSVEAANQWKEQLKAQVPLGRVGRAEELAGAALFLASDDSSYVAGTELFVDGGMAQV